MTNADEAKTGRPQKSATRPATASSPADGTLSKCPPEDGTRSRISVRNALGKMSELLSTKLFLRTRTPTRTTSFASVLRKPRVGIQTSLYTPVYMFVSHAWNHELHRYSISNSSLLYAQPAVFCDSRTRAKFGKSLLTARDCRQPEADYYQHHRRTDLGSTGSRRGMWRCAPKSELVHRG